MTLLLGPPGCGKTTLLLALAGKLSKSLKITGDVSYNGCKLDEFVPHKTSAYISQNDLHIPEMTVRETLDFSALCLGVGSRAGGMNGSRHCCWRICCEARCSQTCTCYLGTAGCGVLLGVGMRVLVDAAGARLRIEQGGALTPQQSC